MIYKKCIITVISLGLFANLAAMEQESLILEQQITPELVATYKNNYSMTKEALSYLPYHSYIRTKCGRYYPVYNPEGSWKENKEDCAFIAATLDKIRLAHITYHSLDKIDKELNKLENSNDLKKSFLSEIKKNTTKDPNQLFRFFPDKHFPEDIKLFNKAFENITHNIDAIQKAAAYEDLEIGTRAAYEDIQFPYMRSECSNRYTCHWESDRH